MFEVHLALFSKDGEVGLAFPLVSRLISLGLAAVLLAASLTGESPAFLGLILSGLFALGAVYEERWTFIPGTVAFRWGILGLARVREWDGSQIEGLALGTFRRGLVPGTPERTTSFRRGRPRLAVLTLHFTDGSSRVLERRPARHRALLEETAQRLADAAGLTLSRDSSW